MHPSVNRMHPMHPSVNPMHPSVTTAVRLLATRPIAMGEEILIERR